MSIRKRPSKKAKKGYTFQVYFDYTNRYGIKSTYIKGGFIRKKDAENHESLKKAELINTGDIKKINPITVDEVYQLYKKSAPLKKSTMQMYDNKYKLYVGPLFGKYKIALLDNYLIQQQFDTITTLSYGSKDIVLKLLNNLLKYAYNNKFIQDEYKAKIFLGKPNPKKIEPIEDDVFFEYLEYIKNSRLIHKKTCTMALWIGYYTGMRIGEVFALNVNDIDLVNGVIHINKTLEFDYENKSLYISNTKTFESTGSIPIVDELEVLLKDYINDHQYSILISTDDGKYIKPGYLSSNMATYSKRTGKHIHFHMFRHAMASRLFEHDVNPKIAQRVLRHAKIETTLSVYTHLKKDIEKEIINDIFYNKSVKNLSKIN